MKRNGRRLWVNIQADHMTKASSVEVSSFTWKELTVI
jgi:hypothetical protein